ncbi:MAG: DNA-processing protein DprA [Spirosomataceae bacterium]
MQDDKIYQLALKLTPGIGDVLIRNLVSYCGGAREVFQASWKKLEKIPGIGEVNAQPILQKTALNEAEKEIRRAESLGIQILFYTDSDFPERLKRLYDAPSILYFSGNTSLNTTRIVSLVGTRQATDYGKLVTEQIVEELASHHVLVLSGLAYGIDIVAHRAALKHSVPTVGVMGSAVNVIYPAVHDKIAKAMLDNGGLLSESPLDTKPDAPRFVNRNRIIAGMSDAVIVVESAQKGGGLITAEFANNYHREVFAVPGNLNNKYSEGCNDLIRKNKANIFTSVQDIVEALNWDLASSPQSTNSYEPPTLDFSNFTDEEAQVLALLRQQSEMHVDELSWKTQVPMNRLASLLLNLEFQGIIKSLPGKRYALGTY